MLGEVTVLPDDGFGADLVFPVQDYKQLVDGSQVVSAGGVLRGREVAVELVLGPGWEKGELAKGIPVSTGTLSYRRIGPASDALLGVRDDLYRTNLRPNGMAAETNFTVISLEGNPGELAKSPVKMKLFYEKGGEDQYAEFYTNIDLARRKLELLEKDEGYRRQVIQALQQN
jgi:hypothetical protein